MKNFSLQLILSVVALIITTIFIYLSAALPAIIIGMDAPAPFFDGSEGGLYFSNFPIQILNILGVLISPPVTAFIMFKLNKNRKKFSFYVPFIFYLLYLMFLGYIYFVLLPQNSP